MESRSCGVLSPLPVRNCALGGDDESVGTMDGPNLLLTHLERRLLAGRHGFLRHRQHHGDHDVVA
jgi:hypothetical protein